MTISDILEHWATIYKPLSHDPLSKKLEDKSFFRILDIDEQSEFSRNINSVHSPCMLHRVVSSGELLNEKQARVTYQVCFLIKVKDSVDRLGRHDGIKQQQAADELMTMCEDFISYILQLRKHPVCPITGDSYVSEPQLAMELQAIDKDSFAYGVNPMFRGPNWLLADCYWTSIRPLYNFLCNKEQKYIIPKKDDSSREDPSKDNSSKGDTNKISSNENKE